MNSKSRGSERTLKGLSGKYYTLDCVDLGKANDRKRVRRQYGDIIYFLVSHLNYRIPALIDHGYIYIPYLGVPEKKMQKLLQHNAGHLLFLKNFECNQKDFIIYDILKGCNFKIQYFHESVIQSGINQPGLRTSF